MTTPVHGRPTDSLAEESTWVLGGSHMSIDDRALDEGFTFVAIHSSKLGLKIVRRRLGHRQGRPNTADGSRRADTLGQPTS